MRSGRPTPDALAHVFLLPTALQTGHSGAAPQTEGEGSRPSMDLFKAIFASSSESSSEEEEQDNSEDEQAGPEEAGFGGTQDSDTREAVSVAHGMSVSQTWGPKGENAGSRSSVLNQGISSQGGRTEFFAYFCSAECRTSGLTCQAGASALNNTPTPAFFHCKCLCDFRAAVFDY